MAAARERGGESLQPITFQAINEFSYAVQEPIAPHEVRLIRDCDLFYMDCVDKRRQREQKEQARKAQQRRRN